MKIVDGITSTCVLALAALCLVPQARAETAYDIAREAFEKQRNFQDEKVLSRLTLIDAKGDSLGRNMVTITLERKAAEDYSLVQFLDPSDVRGTTLLTYQNPKGDDQQWLFLPELKRVKAIVARNKSGSFMGSEFSFEDITGNTLDKWSYELLPDEKAEGKDCHVIAKRPRYANSGYSRVKVWIEKSSHLTLRTEYFDRKEKRVKVQTNRGWTQYGSSWRLRQIVMENVQSGNKSVLDILDRKMATGLKEADFNKGQMERDLRF